ncbi:MAG: hypothetical protein AB7O24_12010 [Kofleriaceae bacterium]
MSELGAIIVLIVSFVALLSLGGMIIMLSAGALAGKKEFVSSWAPEQEHAFIAFEQYNRASNSKAWTFGIIAAVIVSIVVLGAYAGVKPDMKDVTKDMNMSNLSTKPAETKPAETKPAEAPKPEAPKAETPPAETPPAEPAK